MKKYIYGVLGVLIGFSLSLTITTHADVINTLIGKSIQGEFPVTVDDIKLDKTAVVIDGTSFLPVRAIGSATGYDITFDADLGVILKKNTTIVKGVATKMALPIDQAKQEEDAIKAATSKLNEKYSAIGKLQSQFNIKKNSIESTRSAIDDLNKRLLIITPESDKVQFDTLNANLKTNKDDMAKLQLEANDLQSQINTINATIPVPTP